MAGGTAGIHQRRMLAVEAPLQKAGLVSKSATDQYQYWPISPELDQLVEEIAAAYASSPVAVTEAILSAPSSSIRIFADAFKIKKD